MTKNEYYQVVMGNYRPVEKLIGMIPADKLNWRPGPTFMSVGQAICHLSDGFGGLMLSAQRGGQLRMRPGVVRFQAQGLAQVLSSFFIPAFAHQRHSDYNLRLGPVGLYCTGELHLRNAFAGLATGQQCGAEIQVQFRTEGRKAQALSRNLDGFLRVAMPDEQGRKLLVSGFAARGQLQRAPCVFNGLLESLLPGQERGEHQMSLWLMGSALQDGFH